MKNLLTWKDYPRAKDRLAVVGFSETTRDMAPWDDTEVEIISLNEGYNFPWMKRWDQWFQIHPRWDFQRNSNNNDPNHFLWLKNTEGDCIMCKKTGRVVPLGIKNGQPRDCPACNGSGHYVPPQSREDAFPIYMQRAHDDIPGSVAFPLREISEALIPEENHQRDYFTSSCSMIAGLAFLMEYPQVEFYGFEMGAETEYHYQRAGFEYIVGLMQGHGTKVILPKSSTLFTGPLYAYKSMKQGFRQNLEMRKNFLNARHQETLKEMNKLQGKIELAQSLLPAGDAPPVDLAGLRANLESDKQQMISLLNGFQFLLPEVKNITEMYDEYFWAGTEGGDDESLNMTDRDVTNKHVVLNYGVAK